MITWSWVDQKHMMDRDYWQTCTPATEAWTQYDKIEEASEAAPVREWRDQICPCKWQIEQLYSVFSVFY